MSPITRILQIFFLVAGCVLLGVGMFNGVEKTETTNYDGDGVNFTCGPDASDEKKSLCQGEVVLRSDATTWPLLQSLAGLGLIGVAMTITLGARRETPAAAAPAQQWTAQQPQTGAPQYPNHGSQSGR